MLFFCHKCTGSCVYYFSFQNIWTASKKVLYYIHTYYSTAGGTNWSYVWLYSHCATVPRFKTAGCISAAKCHQSLSYNFKPGACELSDSLIKKAPSSICCFKISSLFVREIFPWNQLDQLRRSHSESEIKYTQYFSTLLSQMILRSDNKYGLSFYLTFLGNYLTCTVLHVSKMYDNLSLFLSFKTINSNPSRITKYTILWSTVCLEFQQTTKY